MTSKNKTLSDLLDRLEAEGNAQMAAVLELIQSTGAPNAKQIVREIYTKAMPSKEQYEAEVRSFEPDFRSAKEMIEYLHLIEDKAGDDAKEYARLYDLGFTREGRKKGGGRAYADRVRKLPKYRPLSYEQFVNELDDLPEHVHRAACEEAFARANAYFNRNAGSSGTRSR